MNTIQFNYFENNELINIKYRTADKVFKMVKKAEKIPYNVNCLNDSFDFIFIVEGEMDALTLIECGIESVISVPNGANTGNNNLNYLDRLIDKIVS
jgi:twinkle protein